LRRLRAATARKDERDAQRQKNRSRETPHAERTDYQINRQRGSWDESEEAHPESPGFERKFTQGWEQVRTNMTFPCAPLWLTFYKIYLDKS
jgi:hypothetical protein